MTGEEKQRALVLYRMRQAEETIGEAEYLLTGSKSPRSIVNRIYYSMFYALLGLLVVEPYSSSKHSGVLAYFNRRFIKEGIFPESLGRSINRAFELRLRSDYREYTELTYEQVIPLIEEAKAFIAKVKEYLVAQGILESA